MGSKILLTTGHSIVVPQHPDEFLDRLEAHRLGGAPVMLIEGSEPEKGFVVPMEISGAEPAECGDEILVFVSLEGAKSWVSDSPGWGAIGQQELEEKISRALQQRGLHPPYKPELPSA
jgi:hypothetical protein